MPITVDELNATPPPDGDTSPSSEPDAPVPEPQIVGWVDEIPKNRRSNPFEKIVREVREFNDPTKIARVTWGDKVITPNKVNQLRKRFKDCEFTQATLPEGGKATYVRFKGGEEQPAG